MRKILTSIFLLASLAAFSQTKQQQTLGNKNTVIQVTGALTVDSFQRLPTDTLTAAPNGSVAVKGAKQYIKDGYWKEVQGAGGGGAADTITTGKYIGVSVYNSVSDIRNGGTPDKGFKRVFTTGYYSAGDGGGASYRWDATSSAADDSSFVIKPTGYTGAGRWILQAENNSYNFLSLGAKNDNATDNAWVWAKFLNKMPSNAASDLFIPNGDYKMNSTMNLTKPIRVHGDIGTYIFFPASVQGVHIYGNQYRAYLPIIENIAFYQTSKSTTDGWVGAYPSGDISETPSAYQYHGILVETMCELKSVLVGGFSGHGIRIYGSVSESKNASHVLVKGGKVEACRGAGIYISGPDANACTIDGMDIRDNELCGIFDESFLGNGVSNCQLHNNGYYHFSHYRQTNANGSPVVLSNYMEGQPLPNYMASPRGMVITQTDGNGWTGDGTFYTSGRFNRLTTRSSLGGSNVTIGLNSDDKKVWLETSNFSGGAYSRLQSADDSSMNYFHHKFDNTYDNIWQFGGLYSVFTETNSNYKRYLRYPSHGFNSLIVGNSHEQSAKGTNPSQILPFSYVPGDKVFNATYNGTNVPYWVNLQGGVTDGAGVKAYTGTVQVKTDGSNVLITNGATTDLHAGDALVVDGTVVTLLSNNLQSGSTNYFLIDKSLPANATWRSVTSYATPQWRAQGSGIGTTAQRPTLTTYDRGFWFFNTDSTKNEYWNGTTWGQVGGSGGGTTTTLTLQQVTIAGNITADDIHLYKVGGAANLYIQTSNGTTNGMYLGTGGSGTTGAAKYGGFEVNYGTDKFSLLGFDGTSAVERITYDINGKVGIGTTSPAHALDIAGQSAMIRGASNAAILNFWNLGGGTPYGSIGVDLAADKFNIKHYVGGAANTVLQFSSAGAAKLPYYGAGSRTGTATKGLGVDASGNVIETTATVTYTPTSSTDNTYPVGTLAADDGYLYRRKSDGTWVKIAWGTFSN